MGCFRWQTGLIFSFFFGDTCTRRCVDFFDDDDSADEIPDVFKQNTIVPTRTPPDLLSASPSYMKLESAKIFPAKPSELPYEEQMKLATVVVGNQVYTPRKKKKVNLEFFLCILEIYTFPPLETLCAGVHVSVSLSF